MMSLSFGPRGRLPNPACYSSRAAVLVARPCRTVLSARHSIVAQAAGGEQESDTALTGEWPVNWSLASYEDVGEFFQQEMFKDTAAPGTTLKDVMSTALSTVTADDRADSVKDVFKEASAESLCHCHGVRPSLPEAPSLHVIQV